MRYRVAALQSPEGEEDLQIRIARRMETSRTQVERFFDPEKDSIQTAFCSLMGSLGHFQSYQWQFREFSGLRFIDSHWRKPPPMAA
jgi:hypothetical protein